MENKKEIDSDELATLRNGLLAVINKARNTVDYRDTKLVRDKIAVRHADPQKFTDIPPNLPGLLNDNKILNDMAQWLAVDNAAQTEVTHTGSKPGYTNLGDRADKFGYNNSTRNTAARFLTEACSMVKTGDELQAANGILNSTSHFRPFFSKDGDIFTHIGLGIAKGADGNSYFVAVFGNPKGNEQALQKLNHASYVPDVVKFVVQDSKPTIRVPYRAAGWMWYVDLSTVKVLNADVHYTEHLDKAQKKNSNILGCVARPNADSSPPSWTGTIYFRPESLAAPSTEIPETEDHQGQIKFSKMWQQDYPETAFDVTTSWDYYNREWKPFLDYIQEGAEDVKEQPGVKKKQVTFVATYFSG